MSDHAPRTLGGTLAGVLAAARDQPRRPGRLGALPCRLARRDHGGHLHRRPDLGLHSPPWMTRDNANRVKISSILATEFLEKCTSASLTLRAQGVIFSA